MVSQQAVRFYKRVGYHPYEGITEDFSERERILKALARTARWCCTTTACSPSARTRARPSS